MNCYTVNKDQGIASSWAWDATKFVPLDWTLAHDNFTWKRETTHAIRSFAIKKKRNRPFARSGHMVQNHTCWWTSCAVDFQNNATHTSQPGPAFVLEVPLRNLLTSMCDFAPCDRIVQRAYCKSLESSTVTGSTVYIWETSRCIWETYFVSVDTKILDFTANLITQAQGIL